MKALILFSLLLSPLAENLASAATIQLGQGGWSNGGRLTVTFSGEDGNADGGIDRTELTGFLARFLFEDGGSTDFGLGDLVEDGFFYTSPDSYFVRAENSHGSLYEIAVPEVRFGLFSDTDGGVDSFTEDALAPVPEPGSGLLLGGCGLVIGALRRRLLV